MLIYIRHSVLKQSKLQHPCPEEPSARSHEQVQYTVSTEWHVVFVAVMLLETGRFSGREEGGTWILIGRLL